MTQVIESIFDYASTYNFSNTVRQFRLVCKLWCRISTKKFRDIYGQIDFENDFDRGTARFIEVMQNCEDIPFKRFKFTGGFVLYKPYRGDFSYDRIFETLLSVCSPAIQELEFYTHNPSDLKLPKPFRGIMFENLKVLSFKMCVYYDRLQEEMPSLLETFFKCSPRLEKLELTITTPDGETTEDQLELIEVFGDLIVSKLPKSCKHLKLNMPFTNSQLDRFGFQNVFLDSLNVDFRNSPVSTASLVKFLESQQHTIRDLQLIECPVRIVKDTLRFPCLIRLRIEGRAILPCFPFKKVFPALETFEVVFYWIYQEDRWLSNVFGENTYSDSVKQLKICCWVTDSDVQIFQRVSKNYPRLRKLQLNVDSFAVLREIFQIMNGIEELEMSLGLEFWRKGGWEVDSVFTGLPSEWIRECKDDGRGFTCSDLPFTLNEPSLRNLQSEWLFLESLKFLKKIIFN